MKDLYRPMFFTSITSAVGFGSLALADIPPVRIFGLFVAFGIMAAWLFTHTIVPAIIMLMNEEKLTAFLEKRQKKTSRLDKMLKSFGRFSFYRSKAILVASLIVLFIGVIGIYRFLINYNPVKCFKPSHKIRIADDVMNKFFGGTYMAYLVAEGEKEEWDFSASYVVSCDTDSVIYVGVPEPVSDYKKGEDLVFKDFQAFINDRKIVYQIKKNTPASPGRTLKRIIVWPINFKNKKSAIIRNSYTFIPDVLGQADETMRYTFRTASLWINNIETAKITVKANNLDPFYLVKASPENYVFKDNSIEWIFSNFKPDRDIYVFYRHRFQSWVMDAHKAITDNNPKEILHGFNNEVQHLEVNLYSRCYGNKLQTALLPGA